MALDGTYSGLLASVASWINRTDLTASIPDFVGLAESRIARELRLRKQVTVATLATVGGANAVTLPSDWLEFESIAIADSIGGSLEFVTLEQFYQDYPSAGISCRPYVFSILGDGLLLGPVPDAVYSVTATYYAKFPALASANTNWLLVNHAGVYLYGSLREAALFIKDSEAAAAFDQLYKQLRDALAAEDDMAAHSGSTLRVRTR